MYNAFNPLNPVGILPVIPIGLGQQRQALPRVDVGGIYKLSTNGVSLDTVNSQVVYGINPCEYALLPCESLILLTVHADVPVGGEAFPIALALPSGGSSTTTTTNSADNTGVKKVNVVDSQGTTVTGADITGSTERLLYLNKRTGTARLMEYTASTAATTTPAT